MTLNVDVSSSLQLQIKTNYIGKETIAHINSNYKICEKNLDFQLSPFSECCMLSSV